MAHDDPFAGKTSHADWAYYLDTSGTYTPTLTAATTDPDLGADGVAEGTWHRSGHLITFWARFQFLGTGLSGGSGRLQISLPFDANVSLHTLSATGGEATVVGSGRLRDNTTTSNSIDVTLHLESTEVAWMTQDGTNSSVSEGSPITWGGSDRISVMGQYVADPSGLPS